MMTLLNRKKLLVILAVLALAFSSGSSVLAQNDVNERGLISVDFKGGTVAAYLTALAKAAGSVNVLVSPDAADASMPAVKLTKVSVSAAIDLVAGIRTEKGDPTLYIEVDHVKQYDGREQRTYRINAEIDNRRPKAEERSQSKVWSIAHLIQDGVFDSHAVLDAVETAVEITKSQVNVDIRFHEATGLLIVSGGIFQLNAIDEVLSELDRSHQMEIFRSSKLHEQQIETISQELAETRDQAQVATDKLAQLEDENKALRLEIETQMMRFAEVSRMLSDRESMLQHTTSNLRELQALVDRTQKQADDDKSDNKNN